MFKRYLTEDCDSRFCPKVWARQFRASLSLKLIAIFVGGSIGLAFLIGGLSQFGLERHFLQTVQPLLSHYRHYLADELGSPADIQRAKTLTERWPLTIRIFGEQQQWASDENLREPQINQHRWLDDSDKSQFAAQQPLQFYWDRGSVFLLDTVGSSRVYYGLQLRPSGRAWFPLMLIGIVLLGLYGFYRLTRQLFNPINAIKVGLQEIGAGQLNHRIISARTDELGELVTHVNQMADRLEQMMQAKRDLLLALSHELKSPLARSRVTVELLDDSPYKQTLIDDQHSIQKLIDEIIEAERNHLDHAVTHRQVVNMNNLSQSVINDLNNDQQIIQSYCPDSSMVSVDPALIKRLLRNLLENALRYNRKQIGPISLQCEVDQSHLKLIVSDHGPGIEVTHLSRLTEAFYRADPSRERKSGGLGLGLYLCQAVVDAHQGEITITSEVGKGTKVTCLIPL